MTPSQSAHAWLDYVAQVHAQHDPRGGWASLSQLPKLSADDLALALDAHPDLLDDVLVRPTELAYWLRTDNILGGRQYIADSVLTQLADAVRKRLLSDLIEHEEQCELAAATASAERMGMTDEQYGAHIRGVA